jgi:hypothetical protein
MTYNLAIINPPEADCFSFAARSAANGNNILLCDLCGLSTAQSGTGGEYFFKLCTIARHLENATYFVLPLVCQTKSKRIVLVIS